jgi:hypothetical protein
LNSKITLPFGDLTLFESHPSINIHSLFRNRRIYGLLNDRNGVVDLTRQSIARILCQVSAPTEISAKVAIVERFTAREQLHSIGEGMRNHLVIGRNCDGSSRPDLWRSRVPIPIPIPMLTCCCQAVLNRPALPRPDFRPLCAL